MEEPDIEDPRAETASALPKTVGAIVIYYAMLEHWIDGIVFCLYDYVDGAKGLEKHHPYNAKAEIDFMRVAFERLPALAAYKEEALKLLDMIEPLADFRHNVVHGHVRRLNWASGTLEFSRKFKGPRGVPVRRTLSCNVHDLFEQGRKIKALIEPFMHLTHRLVREFDPSHPKQEVSGSLGWTLPTLLPAIKKIHNKPS